MSKSKKQAKAFEDLLGMLAANAGKDVDELKKEVPRPIEENPFSTPSMQKELCLELIAQPGRYTGKSCKYCGEHFGTSYNSVAFCSDLCRMREFEETTGVSFNLINKGQYEMWGGEPPRIIKPTLWKTLAQLMKTLEPVIQSMEPPVPEQDQEQEILPQTNLPQPTPTNRPSSLLFSTGEPKTGASLTFEF